ncbi:MAG: hypothetical protein ACOZAM_25680 [Pseudomonadota bacterium]
MDVVRTPDFFRKAGANQDADRFLEGRTVHGPSSPLFIVQSRTDSLRGPRRASQDLGVVAASSSRRIIIALCGGDARAGSASRSRTERFETVAARLVAADITLGLSILPSGNRIGPSDATHH